MTEPSTPKADRHQTRRDKRQAERERTGDTPEATAEHAKDARQKQYDEERLKQLGERTGVYI